MSELIEISEVGGGKEADKDKEDSGENESGFDFKQERDGEEKKVNGEEEWRGKAAGLGDKKENGGGKNDEVEGDYLAILAFVARFEVNSEVDENEASDELEGVCTVSGGNGPDVSEDGSEREEAGVD